MAELIELNEGRNLPTQFDPAKTHGKQEKLAAVADYAKRVKDWPLLEKAVDSKVEEQVEFVGWWEAKVAGPGPRKQLITDTVINSSEAEKLTGFTTMRVSRLRSKLKDQDKYKQQLYGAAWKKAFPEQSDENHLANGTGENEWYTPQKYIEAAKDVMGGIDLDPASSELAQEHIRADAYFTQEDNALTKEWFGRVWLNPPYSKELIGPFVHKLADEIGSGRVQEAILLTHNYTDTAWFHTAESAAARICFTRGRIAFESPSGEKAAPTQGQAFFYYGDNIDAFESVFTEFGFIR